MANGTISMKKLKSILQLKYGAALSHRQIAKSLSISASVVSDYARRASQLGLTTWPLPEDWDDVKLALHFLNTRIVANPQKALPDWGLVATELKRKGVTLELLWQENAERHPDNHYSYTPWCRLFREFKPTLKPSLRQQHLAGEKLFVDYAGQTVTIVNPEIGEEEQAQIFVAVRGASNYTYAEATWTQQLEDGCMSHKRTFEYLGGVPELVIPDNLKSAVSKACRYEPDLNPSDHQLAQHYGVAVMPARPYKPKDKAKAEAGVLLVERWVLACLRYETFYSLHTLNQRIRTLLERVNNKPFQKLPGSRQSQFKQLDQPALMPLPKQSYQFVQVKKVRVNIDYHVDIERHYYSVPYHLIKLELQAHISASLVQLYHQGRCVTCHPKSRKQGAFTTQAEHMPKSHQKHLEWTPSRLTDWGRSIGPAVHEWVRRQLDRRQHVEQSYRSCLGLLHLTKSYPKPRVNAACQRGLDTGAYRLKHIKNILKHKLDQQVLPEMPDLLAGIEETHQRGAKYYH